MADESVTFGLLTTSAFQSTSTVGLFRSHRIVSRPATIMSAHIFQCSCIRANLLCRCSCPILELHNHLIMSWLRRGQRAMKLMSLIGSTLTHTNELIKRQLPLIRIGIKTEIPDSTSSTELMALIRGADRPIKYEYTINPCLVCGSSTPLRETFLPLTGPGIQSTN